MRRLFIFFWLGCIGSAQAQLLPIRNYGIREGLNAASISAVLRDSRGMLWVGTYNGVNLYDGSRFLQPKMSTRSGQIYVNQFLEDSRRRICIATWYSGLYIYADGVFNNYLPDTVDIGSQVNSILHLTELPDGRLLCGTDHNAYVFDGRRFTLFDAGNPQLDRQITGVACTPGGDVLLGTTGGLAHYRRNGSYWRYDSLLLQGAGINDVVTIAGETWVSTGRGLYYAPSLPAFRLLVPGAVVNLFVDGNRTLWYTAAGGGIWRQRPGEAPAHFTRENGLPASQITCGCTDNEGITWLGTEDGLAKLTPAGYRFFPVTEGGDRAIITALARVDRRSLWAGSYGNLFRFEGAEARIRQDPEGRRYGFIYAMLTDRRHRLWICASTGLYCQEGARIERRLPARISSIAEDSTGTLWFGADDGRVFYLAQDRFHEPVLANRVTNRITGIWRDGAGFCWIGYALSGLRRLQLIHDSLVTVHSWGKDNGYPRLLVRSLRDDHHGHILVGTRTSGLYVFAEEGHPVLTPDKALQSTHIPLALSPDNGSHGNPVSLGSTPDKQPQGTRTPLSPDKVLPDNHTLRTRDQEPQSIPLASDREPQGNHTLRAPDNGSHGNPISLGSTRDKQPQGTPVNSGQEPKGTHTPLNSDKDLQGTHTPFTPDNALQGNHTPLILTRDQGLSGNWIKDIAVGDGQVFLATNNGLDVLETGAYTKPVRHVTFNDDRVPVEFNTLLLAADTLWLGNARGVLEYSLRGGEPDTLPPPVRLLKLSVNGQADSGFRLFTGDTQLGRLGYTQNNLSVDFAALSFRDEDRVQYRYRLEGLDTGWNGYTDRRYVNYMNLTPGNYRLLVEARNGDGLVSRQPAVVSFSIAAPFWRTPWFLTASTLLLLGLAYGGYRYRLHQLLAMERLRARISTDLHDDTGSTLSSISILSDMALQEAAGEATLTPMLKEIRDNSLSLLEKMDDIVWSINPRNDTLESLMLRVKRFAAQLFEARGIEYEIDIEPGIRHLRLLMDHRQNLYLIMKEAINNLVKYAEAGKARIRAGYERHHLVVEISDDGIGFTPEAMATGNGIINMRSRAAAMNAQLAIRSTPGKGTTVSLSLKTDRP